MEEKFDKIDLKILAELAKDARLPFTTIARKAGAKADVVRYRIEQFEKKGIIKGYRTIINVQSIGYESYHSFIRVQGDHSTFQKKIQACPFVRSCIRYIGSYDYEIAYVAKSLQEAEKYRKEMIGEHFIEEITLPLTSTLVAKVLPSSFIKETTTKIIPFIPLELDEKDFAILQTLTNNARMPSFQIAKQNALSIDTVLYRIRKMKQHGVIQGFVPFLDVKKLGLSFTAVLIKTKQSASLQSTCHTLSSLVWGASLLGNWNGILYFFHKGNEELQKEIDILQKQITIDDMRILSEREQGYYNYFPDVVGLR